MKNIHWLTPENWESKKKISNYPLASVRLRMAMFLHPTFRKYRVTFSESFNIKEVDYLFLAKMGANRISYTNQFVNLINQSVENNKKVFIDYTDHHLGNSNSEMYDFYKKIINKNINVTVSSNLLREEIKNYCKEVFLIEDPYEIDIQKVTKNNNRTFLWFGHPTNTSFLFKFISNWKPNFLCHLYIMTSPQGLNHAASELNKINLSKNIQIKLFYWSLENMIKIKDSISGILIPGDTKSIKKNVSNNRLITSFALGCPVAATHYDSYLEYKKYFCNIDDEDEFNCFVEDNSFYKKKVSEAQFLIKNYSTNEIAKKWLKIIND